MQMLVQPKSKHCRQCDKCVAGFDHHCVFLNNCIGTRNYGAFIALLCSIMASAACHSGIATYLLAQSSLALPSISGALSRIYGGRISTLVFRAVAGASASLAALVVVLVAELAAFHTFLHVRGLSTYEFVVLRRAARDVRTAAAIVDSDKTPGLDTNRVSADAVPAEGGNSCVNNLVGCCPFRVRRRIQMGLVILRGHGAKVEPYPVGMDAG